MQNKTLTSNMWNLLASVKGLLEPVENLTKDLSSYDAFLSLVIPAVLGLGLALQSDNRDSGLITMKSGLTDAVRERFEPLLTNTVATAATALDPRYKLTFFPD